MARQSAFNVRIDVSQVEALVTTLSTVTPETMGRMVVDAVNRATESAYELGRQRMLSGINLTDDYVQRKMRVDPATENNPKATITAFGSRDFLTSLSHYGAMQIDEPVNWSNSRILGMGKKFAPWPGWTQRKGNPALGIAADRKAAGRSVEVIKGSRKKIGPAFSIPGKVDNNGNPIVFRLTRDKKVEALQGPSVYQLFRVAAAEIEPQVADDLQQAVIAVAAQRLLERLA